MMCHFWINPANHYNRIPKKQRNNPPNKRKKRLKLIMLAMDNKHSLIIKRVVYLNDLKSQVSKEII